MATQNLNNSHLDIDRPHEHSQEQLRSFDRQSSVMSGNITAVFDDLEARLIAEISKADLVVGCVAWLTHYAILDALAQCGGVSLVVQKEDFLRPDIAAKERNQWAVELRSRYDALKIPLERYDMPGLISELSVCGSPEMYPVRCVGNFNRDKNPAFPRCHHKFVVFCRVDGGYITNPTGIVIGRDFQVTPYAVWTGSFNFTVNACRSFENAVVINDPTIAQAYYNEYAYIYGLSEPLDWESEWVAPEYRIGS